MMKGKKVYSKLSVLVIIILLIAGTQVLAASLGKVTGVRATPTSNSVTVRWNSLKNAKQYQVEIYIPGIGWAPQGKCSGTSKSISALNPGTQYKVRVRAYNGNTSGAYSTEVTFRTTGGSNTTTKLGKVTNFRATKVDSNSATFAYNKVANAKNYQVYLRTANTSYSSIGFISSTSLRVPNLQPNTTYYIKVRAYNSASNYGEFSSEVLFRTKGSSGNTNPTTLGKVTGVRAVPTSNKVTVYWNKVSNATQYQVDIYIPGIGWAPQGKYAGTSKSISALEPGTQYKVRVRAFNGSASGAYSAEVTFKTTGGSSTTRLGQVTNLKATNIQENYAIFTYNKVTNARNYEIYLRTSSTSYRSIGFINTTSLRVPNLQANTTYYIKVRAYNSASDYGEFSKEVIFTTKRATGGPIAPAQVTNVQARPTSNEVTVTWGKVTGATSYQVSIYIPGGMVGWAPQAHVTGTSKVIGGLQPGVQYKVKVTAYNGSIKGQDSREVTFRTPSVQIGRITDLRATKITSDSVEVTWSKATNASAYDLYLNVPGIGYVFVRRTTNNVKEVIGGLVAGRTYRVKVIPCRNENRTVTYGTESNEIPVVAENKTTVGKVTGLTAAPTTNKVSLSWQAVTGATKYEVTVNDQELGFVYKTNTPVTGLEAGKTYRVKVRAYIGNTPGEYSNEIRFTTNKNQTNPQPNPSVTPPAKVTGVTLSNITENGVQVSFNKADGATGYRIYMVQVNVNGGNTCTTTETSKTFNTLFSNTLYEVMVESYKIVDGREISAELSEAKRFTTLQKQQPAKTKVGKVTGVNVRNITAKGATFTYNGTSGATGYLVYIREEGRAYGNANIMTNERVATIATLKPNTRYYVKIEGYRRENGQIIRGEASTEVKFATGTNTGTPSTAIKNLKITSVTKTAINLSWDNSNSATYYNLYYREAGKTQFYMIGGTKKSPTSISISAFEPGKKYEIAVKMQYINSAGQRAYGTLSTPIVVTIPK